MEFLNNGLKLTESSCDNKDVCNNGKKTQKTSLLSTDPNIPSQQDVNIPNIYVTQGNDSIKVITTNLTWDDAKKHCEGDKASLASLRNEWTKAYVELLAMNLNAPVWIGLNRQQVQGHLRLQFCCIKTPIQYN